jgi:hypothetical protein
MCTTFEPLPSPLMGEGAGGGEDSTSSPHPNLPPRGEGVLTYPCQPLAGEDPGGGESRASLHPYPDPPPSRGRGTLADRAVLRADVAGLRSDVGHAEPTGRGRGESQAEPGRALAALDGHTLICKPP